MCLNSFFPSTSCQNALGWAGSTDWKRICWIRKYPWAASVGQTVKCLTPGSWFRLRSQSHGLWDGSAQSASVSLSLSSSPPTPLSLKCRNLKKGKKEGRKSPYPPIGLQIYILNHQATLQLTWCGRRLKGEEGNGRKETRRGAQSLPTGARSINNGVEQIFLRNRTSLFYFLRNRTSLNCFEHRRDLGGSMDISHTETCLLLPSASLTQEKQCSGTVYPSEHFTFAPGTEIKAVYSTH